MSNRSVTDPALVGLLARRGFARAGVSLVRDYGRRVKGKSSPYMKLYRDRATGRAFSVFSGLPMVDAYGQGHELAWTQKNGVWENGNNIFHAVVEDGSVKLIALSGQPDGAPKDAETSYHPQLFVGGAEVPPLSLPPTLLDDDPVNAGYHGNVLEWDYGVCKRRLRIIEGRYRERWRLAEMPKGDVRVKHNFSGRLRLNLGHCRDANGMPVPVIATDDEEIVALADLAAAAFPVEIGASLTVYPDADPETATVDGLVGNAGFDDIWANVKSGAGTYGASSASYLPCVNLGSSATTGQWERCERTVYLFDTSALPDSCIVSSAALALCGGGGKTDAQGRAPGTCIYSSSPASNIDLAASDFAEVGSIAFASTISYAAWTSGYNDFALNSSGIAAISKNGVSKFSARNPEYDVGTTIPAWGAASSPSYTDVYMSEQGGGSKPKLVVEWVLPSADAGGSIEVSFLDKALALADAGEGTDASAPKEFFAGDSGPGRDDFKYVLTRAGSDLKLPGHEGRVGMPSKGVQL